jgi:hypothetical protein
MWQNSDLALALHRARVLGAPGRRGSRQERPARPAARGAVLRPVPAR